MDGKSNNPPESCYGYYCGGSSNQQQAKGSNQQQGQKGQEWNKKIEKAVNDLWNAESLRKY